MIFAWHDFLFRLPDDWEAVRYSIAFPEGRFEFANRYGPLGRFSWEKVKKRPDEGRILEEYHRRYLRDHDKAGFKGFSGIKTQRVGDFILGYRDAGEPCQAITYLYKTGRFFTWAFPVYTERLLAEVIEPILMSFQRNDGEIRRWSAFGVSANLPRGFDIEWANIRPADAWLEFQHTNMHRCDLHCWALPGELLREDDLAGFGRRILKASESEVVSSYLETWQGMDSAVLETRSRGTKGMDRLYASFWPGRARLWHNEAIKRVFAFVQSAPKKVSLLLEDEVLD